MAKTDTLNDWKKTKKEFEKLTGKKKPTEKGKVFFVSYRKSTGIESALKKCDAVSNDASKLKELAKALADFKKQKDKYLALLTVAIKDLKDKNEKGIYYKGLKMLRSRLEKHEAILEDALNAGQAAAESGGDMYKVLEKSLDKNIKSALKQCLAAIKHVKASPTAKTWNSEFSGGNGVARKLATALQGVVMLKAKAKKDKAPPFSYKNDMEALSIKLLDPYATGDLMSLATDEEVPPALRNFTDITKATAQSFK